MPVLSRFYGLVVYMNFRQHSPPHFHARYQGDEVAMEISSGRVSDIMSRRASACSSSGWKPIAA
ncbi:MAG: DUF4160 domain-containing protein, partial [Candidatus Eisenbacteria bacterium]|nr:DUF4160 domain-containing protein [Candidatus Eisenbacteria bacterium]